MNNITKISEITYRDVADYIRLCEISQDEENTLTNLINISIDYISKYTGISSENLDNYNGANYLKFVPKATG